MGLNTVKVGWTSLSDLILGQNCCIEQMTDLPVSPPMQENRTEQQDTVISNINDMKNIYL